MITVETKSSDLDGLRYVCVYRKTELKAFMYEVDYNEKNPNRYYSLAQKTLKDWNKKEPYKKGLHRRMNALGY